MDSEKEFISALKGYKEKIHPVNKATLTWERELIFLGRTQRGYEIEFDANMQWGCSPTEALLLSLAGCMAIDMVTFLEKMRADLKNLRIEIIGERNPQPPQYYKRIEMILHITAGNITERQVERAINLSHEKYCSVYHSLRKDIEVKVNYILNPIEEK